MASGTENRKRTRLVSVRLHDKEWAALAMLADERGLSLADYTRATMLIQQAIGVRVRHRVPTRAEVALAKFTIELSAHTAALNLIGGHVNQLAHAVNVGGTVPKGELKRFANELQALQKNSDEIRAAVLSALRVEHEEDVPDDAPLE